MSPTDLLTLAKAYADATGMSLSAVSRAACNGHHKFLGRLEQGLGANTVSVQRAAEWLTRNWPENAPWPRTVPRPTNPSASDAA